MLLNHTTQDFKVYKFAYNVSLPDVTYWFLSAFRIKHMYALTCAHEDEIQSCCICY
jgi:hypothetical protein